MVPILLKSFSVRAHHREHQTKKFIHENRQNLLMSKLVDISARIADRGFTQDAAGVCNKNDVPFDVALRVITQPTKRRKNKR